MEYQWEWHWKKGISPQDLIAGCRELYGGNLNDDVIQFKNELVRKGFAIRQVGNGPKLHDGMIIRFAKILPEANASFFALLRIDAREWIMLQERLAKELINPKI